MSHMIDAVVILFSTLVGSFLNVCIYRLPREASLWGPRSHCPDCERLIAWYDNIPILSFLWLKGRCRHCHGSISWQYPVVEACTALAGWAVYRQFDLTLEGAAFGIFTFAMIVLTAIDLEHQILPNVITYPLTVTGLLLSFVWDHVTPWPSLIGACVGAGSLYLIAVLGQLIWHQEAMGLGDVKLGAAMGAWLGTKHVLISYFIAFSLGALVGGLLVMLGLKKWRGGVIPFGPFLAIGAVILVFFHMRLDEFFVLAPFSDGL